MHVHKSTQVHSNYLVHERELYIQHGYVYVHAPAAFCTMDERRLGANHGVQTRPDITNGDAHTCWWGIIKSYEWRTYGSSNQYKD